MDVASLVMDFGPKVAMSIYGYAIQTSAERV